MSVALFGVHGELVLIKVVVDPRHLEDLLEALARLDFPVNPELHHRPGAVVVVFPAYASQVSEVRKLLDYSGLETASLDVFGMLGLPAA